MCIFPLLILESYANLVLHIDVEYTEGMADPNDNEYTAFESSLQAQVQLTIEFKAPKGLEEKQVDGK